MRLAPKTGHDKLSLVASNRWKETDMMKRFSEEQIIGALKRYEAGESTRDLCRELGITMQALYQWKKKFRGMEVSEAKRLRELEHDKVSTKSEEDHLSKYC